MRGRQSGFPPAQSKRTEWPRMDVRHLFFCDYFSDTMGASGGLVPDHERS